jgi:hypothetical protein
MISLQQMEAPSQKRRPCGREKRKRQRVVEWGSVRELALEPKRADLCAPHIVRAPELRDEEISTRLRRRDSPVDAL